MIHLHESDYVTPELRAYLLTKFTNKRAVCPFFHWVVEENENGKDCKFIGYNPLLVNNYKRVTLIVPKIDEVVSWADQLNKATRQVSFSVRKEIDDAFKNEETELTTRKRLCSRLSITIGDAFRISPHINPLTKMEVIPYQPLEGLKDKGFIETKDEILVSIDLSLASTFNWSISPQEYKLSLPDKITFDKRSGKLFMKWKEEERGTIGWNGTETIIIGDSNIHKKMPEEGIEIESLSKALQLEEMLKAISSNLHKKIQEEVKRKVILSV